MDGNDSCGNDGCHMRRILCGLTEAECCEYRVLDEVALDVPRETFLRYIRLGDRIDAGLLARMPRRTD